MTISLKRLIVMSFSNLQFTSYLMTRPHGVRVNVGHPCATDTPLLRIHLAHAMPANTDITGDVVNQAFNGVE
jgi:NAD(P)-dependent dehydrogenase (short-subunit alcohol dehydrogenase family)